MIVACFVRTARFHVHRCRPANAREPCPEAEARSAADVMGAAVMIATEIEDSHTAKKPHLVVSLIEVLIRHRHENEQPDKVW